MSTTGRLRSYAGRVRRFVRRVGDRPAGARNAAGSAPATPTPATAGTTIADPVRLGPVRTRLRPEIEQVIEAVRAEHLSYIRQPGLRTLAKMVINLDRKGIAGLIVETGTALGGSAIVMATAKSPDRAMKIYDVFGMIPPPSDRDGEDVIRRYETIVSGASEGLGGEQYYGYRSDVLGEVVASFARHGVPTKENNVELVQGLFEETLDLHEPVALAHLDGDWYESTMTCLTRITPLLSRGGRLVIDDYEAWSGCRTAVDEYFAGRTGFRFERRGKLHIVRL